MAVMTLLELRGGYLYEHRPDLVPDGYLSNDELALWSIYYERRSAERG